MERLALEGVSRVISVGFQNGFQSGRPFWLDHLFATWKITFGV